MSGTGRLHVALREALRTTVARPWRLVLAALLGGLIMAAPAIFETIALDGLADVLAEERARGSAVLIVESESGQLDGHECSAVAAQQGVVAAGGTSAPTVVSVGEPALTTARSVLATSGYFEILWGAEPRYSEPTAVLGSDLAHEQSIADGAPIVLGDDRVLAAASARPSPREDSRGRWITIPVGALPAVQQCWVEVSPESLDAVRAALPAMFPDATGLTVSAMRDDARTELAIAGWTSRPGRWLSLACGAVAGLMVGTLIAPRRAEYALYRLLGLSRPTVLVIALVEALLLIHAAVLLAGLVSGAVIPVLDPIAPAEILTALLLQIGLTGAIAATAAGTSCLLVTSGNAAHAIRSHR